MIHKENILKKHIKGYVGGSIAFFSFLSMFGIGFSNWVIAAEGDIRYTDLTIEADTIIIEDKYVQCFENITITQPLYYSDTYGYLGDDDMFSTSSGVKSTIKGTFNLKTTNVRTITDIDMNNISLTFSIVESSYYSIFSSELSTSASNVSIESNTLNISESVTGDISFSFSITIQYLKSFSEWTNKTFTLKLSLN